jgi:hypothetical protein
VGVAAASSRYGDRVTADGNGVATPAGTAVNSALSKNLAGMVVFGVDASASAPGQRVGV